MRKTTHATVERRVDLQRRRPCRYRRFSQWQSGVLTAANLSASPNRELKPTGWRTSMSATNSARRQSARRLRCGGMHHDGPRLPCRVHVNSHSFSAQTFIDAWRPRYRGRLRMRTAVGATYQLSCPQREPMRSTLAAADAGATRNQDARDRRPLRLAHSSSQRR
jgi:hypothetical protein